MQSNRSLVHRIALPAITFILGVGCASAVYWLLLAPGSRDQLSDTVAPSSPIESNSNSQEQDSTTEVSGSAEPPEFTASTLDEIAVLKSTSEQQLALRIFLSHLDEEQVVELLTQELDVFPLADKLALQSAIVQRLAHQNPSRALSLVLEMDALFVPEFVTSVYKDWVHSSLDEAVSRARTLNRRHARIAMNVIVQERTDLSDETVRAIARDLGLERIAMSAVAQRKIEEAIDDPETAWNELVVGFQDDTSLLNEFIRVASAWVEESGLSVLDSISQSLTSAETRQRVMRSVLRDVAHSDPEGAFLYALNMVSDPNKAVLRSVAGVWARSDPSAALLAATRIDDVSVRKATEEKVVRDWAHREPREMLRNVYPVPSELKEIASSAAISALSSESPEEAAQFVATMETSSLKSASARGVALNWSYRDHKAAVDWILNEPGVQEIRFELLSWILHSLVKADPDLAMTTARAQPIEQERRGYGMFGPGLGMEINVIRYLVSSDLDKAVQLLPQVRDGRTKYFAFQRVAQELIRNDEIDKAFDMVNRVPDTDRERVHRAVSNYWIRTEPVAVLNSMHRFPTKGAKSRAALMLITSDQMHRSLTDEQVDEARKYLIDEHAKALEERDSDALQSILLE